MITPIFHHVKSARLILLHSTLQMIHFAARSAYGFHWAGRTKEDLENGSHDDADLTNRKISYAITKLSGIMGYEVVDLFSVLIVFFFLWHQGRGKEIGNNKQVTNVAMYKREGRAYSRESTEGYQRSA